MVDSGDGETNHSESVVDRLARIALVGVLVVFVLCCLVIALRAPVGVSNDEPSHMQNVETLATGHWYGMHLGKVKIFTTGGEHLNVGASSGLEAHQPPLYYLTLAGWQRLSSIKLGMPKIHHGLFSPNPPNHLLIWLRIPNVVMGALTIWFTYLAARIVTDDPWTPVVAASIVAFVPRFVFLSAFLTNDNLVNLLAAILTFAALRYVLAPTRWRMAIVGVVVGLLVITKLSALPLAAVVLVLALGRHEWVKRVELVAISGVASIVVCGWFLVQNTVRYGSPLAGAASKRYLTQIQGTGMPYGVQYEVTDPAKLVFVEVPSKFLHAFWYGDYSVDHAFLWTVPLPISLLFWLLLAFALLSLIGLRFAPRVALVLGVLAATGFLSVWIVAFQTKTYDPVWLLPGLPAVACLAAFGLERWKPVVRILLPVLGLGATLFAIHQNLLIL